MATDKESTHGITRTILDGKLVYDVAGVGKLVFDPAKASAENRSRAMMTRSFSDRIGDAAALPRDKDTGLSASPQDKYDAMKAIVDHLESGSTEWNIKAGDRATIGDGHWLAKAMVELGKARDPAHAAERIKALADRDHKGQLGKARAALMASVPVGTRANEMKAEALLEKPAGSLNSDDLLGEMEG